MYEVDLNKCLEPKGVRKVNPNHALQNLRIAAKAAVNSPRTGRVSRLRAPVRGRRCVRDELCSVHVRRRGHARSARTSCCGALARVAMLAALSACRAPRVVHRTRSCARARKLALSAECLRAARVRACCLSRARSVRVRCALCGCWRRCAHHAPTCDALAGCHRAWTTRVAVHTPLKAQNKSM